MKVIPGAYRNSGADLDAQDRRVIEAIQGGLPLCAEPYRQLAEELELSEAEILSRIRRLKDMGFIKRFGVVVHHRELGYRANAMVVWDIPDERVAELGHCLGQFEFVTLCYRRPRYLPQWPYNLFCMIHGVDRQEVEANVELIVRSCQLEEINHAILFSKKRYKQRGAHYYRNRVGEEK